MNFLDISSYLNSEIDTLKGKLSEMEKRESLHSKMFDDVSVNFRRENFEYKLILKKINKLKELLSILELIKTAKSSDSENMKYRENTVSLYYSLIDLIKKNNFNLDTARGYLENEIKQLNATSKECKFDNSKIDYYKSLIVAISRCKNKFKNENSDDVIDSLMNLVKNIEILDCDSIRYIRFANFDRNLLEKYMSLANSSEHNNLYENLLELSYNSLEDVSRMSNDFLIQYNKLQNYFNDTISTDLEPPLYLKERINSAFDNRPIKNSQVNKLLVYLKKLIKQQECLVRDFNDKFSYNKIMSLRGRMSVDAIEENYWDLLYTYRDVFSQDFRFEKCKNMDEYSGVRSLDNSYYNVSSHRLYRLSTDYQEIRNRAVGYLREYSKKYCDLGVTLRDLDVILVDDNVSLITVQNRLEEVRKRVLNNNNQLLKYYKIVQNYFDNYNSKTAKVMSEIDDLYDDFFFTTYSSIDVDVATSLCSMDKIADCLASSYQQDVFNNKFVMPSAIKTVKK